MLPTPSSSASSGRQAGSQKIATSIILAALVFISGFVTMALEFAASRLLVPVFGSSINTWGVLIGIILAALTVGYHMGGKIADRRPATMEKLGAVIFSAGLYMLFIPLAIWPAVESLAHPQSSLSLALSTLALVAPPTVLLGIVSPYAVKLAASTLATLGKKTGNLYSIATVGSIVGTFATVFVLVPVLETNSIMFSLGLALVIPASAFALRALPKVLAACLAALVFVSALPVDADDVSFSLPLGQSNLNYLGGNVVSGAIVYEAETPYSQLQVVDSRRLGAAGANASDIDSPYYKVRSLYLNGDLHSRMYTDRPDELAVTYTKYFPLGLVFNPDATSVLFVGGGGFSGPKHFLAAYPGMDVDVVEIDPVVIDVAAEYFAVPENERLAIHNDDGRRFLLSEEKEYDIIVLDAYSKSYVPFHLMTEEYYQLLDDWLSPGGVIVSNQIGSMGQSALNYETSKLWRAAYKTMGEVFPSVQVFSTRPGAGGVQNIMLVAGSEAMAEPEIKAGQSALVPEMGDGLQVDYAASLYDPARIRTDDVPVLTDQFAPTEILVSPLDNQPYSIGEEWDAQALDRSTTGSLAGGVTLAMIAIAGVWAIHFRGIWKASSRKT
jgi:predicted membrane-bound spermidine synthase